MIDQQIDVIKSNLKNDILNNSSFINSQNEYLYNDKRYSRIEDIINQELLLNPIQVQKTISNPDKIIKNYNSSELYGDKIFDSNLKNLVKVYKNSINKVVLPSCNEIEVEGCVASELSAQQRATDSFINKGMIKPKYSYDRQKWFSDPLEAKKDYQNTNYNVKSSLFYRDGNDYFNSFNNDDHRRIKSTFSDGFYYDAFDEQYINDPNYKGLDISKPMYGIVENKENENATFEYKFKNNLKEFIDNKIDGILNATYTYQIIFDGGYGKHSKKNYNDPQWFIGAETNFPQISIVATPSNVKPGKLTLTISNEIYKQKLITEDLLLNAITSNNSAYWNKKVHTRKADQKQLSYFNYNLNHNSKNYYLKFTIDTEEDGIHGGINPRGYNQTDIKWTTQTISRKKENYDFLFKREDQLFNDFLETYKVSSIDKNEFLSWLDRKSEKNIDQWLKIFANVEKLSNIAYKERQYVSEYLATIIWDQIRGSIKNGPIHNDFLYGNQGNEKSVLLANKLFKNQFAINFPKDIEDQKVNYNYQGLNYETSYKNWNENFLALEYDNYNGHKLDRYYFVQDEEQDINQFSDEYGELTAPTWNEAKENFFNKDLKILKKAYFFYDINGYERKVEAQSEEEAIEKITKDLDLETKFIHKDELKTLKDQDLNVEDLISDREHYVYKFKNKDNKDVFYKDYQSAYDAYENELKIMNKIQLVQNNNYVYSIFQNEKTYNYYWTSEENIDELVEKIYNKHYIKKGW